MASKIKGFCSFSNGVLNGSKHWYIKLLFPGEIFIVNNIETDKQDLI